MGNKHQEVDTYDITTSSGMECHQVQMATSSTADVDTEVMEMMLYDDY